MHDKNDDDQSRVDSLKAIPPSGSTAAENQAKDATVTPDQVSIEGWAIEVRRSYYRVVNGTTERTSWDSHYCGSFTEDDSKRIYRAIDALIDGNQLPSGLREDPAVPRTVNAPHAQDSDLVAPSSSRAPEPVVPIDRQIPRDFSRDAVGIKHGTLGVPLERRRDPTPQDFKDPRFDVLWELMKRVDVDFRNGLFEGATGNDVCAVLDALDAASRAPEPEPEPMRVALSTILLPEKEKQAQPSTVGPHLATPLHGESPKEYDMADQTNPNPTVPRPNPNPQPQGNPQPSTGTNIPPQPKR